jgi:hypothetical protein
MSIGGLVGQKALHARAGRNQCFLSLGNALTTALIGVPDQYISLLSGAGMTLDIAYLCCGGLLRGCAADRCWPFPRSAAGGTPTFARGDAADPLATTGTALLAVTFFLVHGRPCAPLGLFRGHAMVLVALGDVIRFALLPVRIFRFVAASSCSRSTAFNVERE